MRPEQKLESQEKLLELEEQLTLERNRHPRKATDAEKFRGLLQGSFELSLVAFGLCAILFAPCVIADTVVATVGPAESVTWVIFLLLFVGPVAFMAAGFWVPCARYDSPGCFWALGAFVGLVLYVIWWSPVLHILTEDPLLRSANSVRFLDSARSFGLLAIAIGTAVGGIVGGMTGWSTARDAPEAERDASVRSLRAKRNDLQGKVESEKRKDLAVIERARSSRDSLAGKTEFLRRGASRTRALLEKAERNFTERRFGPFWDAVDNTSTNLLGCRDLIRELTEDVRDYNARRLSLDFTFFPELKSEFTPFRPTLPEIGFVASDLKTLVRAAETDYEFASIYENRKTNVLLAKGFSNLIEGILHLGTEISGAITDLSSEVGDLSSKVGEELEVVTDRMEALGGEVGAVSNAVAQLEGRVSTDASEVRERLHETGEKMDRVDRNVEEIMERWRARQRK